MKLSPREQWMLALMVPVVVLVVGKLAFVRPLRQHVSEQQREVTARGGPETWQARLQAAQSDLAKLQSELEDAQAGLRRALPRLDHSAALKEVSRLCAEGGLSLISTSQDAAATLVPTLRSAVPLIAAENGGTAPEAWKIDLRGSYAQVSRLLAALASAQAFIVPLHLGMKPDMEGLEPTAWELTLWL